MSWYKNKSFVHFCNFLTRTVLLLKSVDYGRMAEILVQRAASPDEFTRLTAITWVSKFTFWIYMHMRMNLYLYSVPCNLSPFTISSLVYLLWCMYLLMSHACVCIYISTMYPIICLHLQYLLRCIFYDACICRCRKCVNLYFYSISCNLSSFTISSMIHVYIDVASCFEFLTNYCFIGIIKSFYHINYAD